MTFTPSALSAQWTLTDKMRESFKRRVAKGEKNPLLWAMHETFWVERSGSAAPVSLALQLLQVISPSPCASSSSSPPMPTSPAWRALLPHIGAGVGLVLAVTIMQMLQSLGTNHFIYRGMLVGGMTRASLISLIYEKSMVISGRAKAEAPRSRMTAARPRNIESETGRRRRMPPSITEPAWHRRRRHRLGQRKNRQPR